jgi:hypothetical protein
VRKEFERKKKKKKRKREKKENFKSVLEVNSEFALTLSVASISSFTSIPFSLLFTFKQTNGKVNLRKTNKK